MSDDDETETETEDPAPLDDIPEGESREMQGSGATPYLLRNTGGVYSCSCPAWRNQSAGIERRSCKHLRKLRGDAAENARIGATDAPRPTRATSGGKPGGEATVPPLLLAHPWEPHVDLSGWWMSEKLDGVRAYWDGTRLLSRLGNELYAPAWFLEGLPPTPLDGELFGGRKRFQRTVSIVRRQDRSDLWKEIRYVVFDAPAMDAPFEDRLTAFGETLRVAALAHVEAHPHERCRDTDHLREALAHVESLGGEGLMLRKPRSRYEVGRSHTLLKVKTFHDAEARVVGHLPGAGRHKGRLGALECEMPDGTRFSVGTGLSDEERRDPPPVGAIVTYRFQELSQDGVPRFPSYVGVRDDVRWTPIEKGAARPVGPIPAPPPAKALAVVTPPPAPTVVTPPPAPAPTDEQTAARSTATDEPTTRTFRRGDDVWSIALVGRTLRVKKGNGPEKKAAFPSSAAAWRDADRRITVQREAGFVEDEDW